MPAERHFTERFMAAQRQAGITLKECAKRAQVSEATIHKALNSNGGQTTVATLEALCDAVGLDPAEVWIKPGGRL